MAKIILQITLLFTLGNAAIGSTISPMDVVEMVESTIIPPNTDRLISTPDNEVQLMRSFDTAKLMGSLLSRNLHNWWARYTEMMHLYRLSFDAKICTDRLNLNNSLNEIEDQVEKVRFGWEQKKEQLDLLYEILHRPEYKNVTGLAEVLNVYLEEQYDILDEEDIKLKQEEDEVAYERKRFNEHPCPCVWSIWTEWPTCSSTCGVGSKQRTRDVETEAINDGTDCLGDKTETAACNTDPCPIDCKWSQWGEWSQCHQTCSPGEKSKMRTHAILAQFGGEECEGDAQMSTQCNTVDDLKQTIAEQAAEIAHLKAQHHHG